MAARLTSTTERQEILDACAQPTWRQDGYEIVAGPEDAPSPGCRTATEPQSERLAEIAEQEKINARKAQTEAYDRGIREAAARNPNWAALMENGGSVYIPYELGQEILHMPEGPRIAEYLAKHPREAEELLTLGDHAARRALERITEKATNGPGSFSMKKFVKLREAQVRERKERLAESQGTRGKF